MATFYDSMGLLSTAFALHIIFFLLLMTDQQVKAIVALLTCDADSAISPGFLFIRIVCFALSLKIGTL